MPTVLRVEGFRFKILNGDHDPPHVHVWRGGASVVIDIVSEAARNVFRMNDPDLRRAQTLVREHRDELLESWLAIQAGMR